MNQGSPPAQASITVRLPAALVAAVDELTRPRGRRPATSRSAVVRAALEAFVREKNGRGG